MLLVGDAFLRHLDDIPDVQARHFDTVSGEPCTDDGRLHDDVLVNRLVVHSWRRIAAGVGDRRLATALEDETIRYRYPGGGRVEGRVIRDHHRRFRRTETPQLSAESVQVRSSCVF